MSENLGKNEEQKSIPEHQTRTYRSNPSKNADCRN